MEHMWLRNFDANGNWTKESRIIRVKQGNQMVEVDMDEYAAEHGIELPDSKKATKHTKSTKSKDIEVNIDADMAESHDEEHTDES